MAVGFYVAKYVNKKSRSEERFSRNAETELVCRLLLEKKKQDQGDPVRPLDPDRRQVLPRPRRLLLVRRPRRRHAESRRHLGLAGRGIANPDQAPRRCL